MSQRVKKSKFSLLSASLNPHMGGILLMIDQSNFMYLYAQVGRKKFCSDAR